jgi:choline monooxygenase
MSESTFPFEPRDLAREPIERAFTLPATLYTDPRSAAIEQRAVFREEWQLVGHVDQLRKPGSSLHAEIAGNPLLIVMQSEADAADADLQPGYGVRTDGGVVRAFHNVCKHRGGPLCVKRGTRSVIQCRYHGWTYRMDGSLRGVPQFAHVELFDKRDFGLEPVRLALWQGLLLVTLRGDAPPPDPLFDGIAERIAPIRLDLLRFHTRVTYDVACNWKVYVDNYLEGYHIPIVHPELAKLLDYSRYMTETEGRRSLQHSPFQDSSAGNPYRAEDGAAFYYFMYPNFMLNILPGRLQLNIVEPNGVDRCRVHFDYFYEDPARAHRDGLIAEDMAYSEQIQDEDIEICEAVQKGLGSDAYHRGRYSVERELGVWHFHECLKQSLRDVFPAIL